VPGAPTGECNGDGINNGTFPLADGHFRTLWGETVTNASIMGCITDAKLESDVLQLKRAVSSPEVDGAGDPITAAPAGNFYLVANINSGTVISAGAVPAIDNAQVWQYQHHVYYVREETVGDNVVPVLMQGQLGSQLTFSPVVDGIDMIRFLYGVDTDSDGIVNAFVSADNMTQGYWNRANDSRIVAVKIYVLARNVRPDLKYTNTNTYVLGDLEVEVNDNYRRLLFSSTVTLFNARLDSW
jgi:type IV pilus assembly protein PilW